MSNVLQYKNYIASIEFSAEDRCMHGKIEHINDLIMFDGGNFEEVEHAFHEAVDNYLQFCKDRNKEPDQPFKGTFNVRVGSSLHRRASIEAKKTGASLNDLVSKAIEAYLEDEKTVRHVHTHSITQTIAFEDDEVTWQEVNSRIVPSPQFKKGCH